MKFTHRNNKNFLKKQNKKWSLEVPLILIVAHNNSITIIGNNSKQVAVLTATLIVGDQPRPHLINMEERVDPLVIMP